MARNQAVEPGCGEPIPGHNVGARRSHTDFALLRIGADGKVKDRAEELLYDPSEPLTFHSAIPESLALLPDGDILVGGTITYDDPRPGADFALVRVNADFTQDTSFSGDGRSIFFVRSRRGLGSLFTLRGQRLSGPLLRIGNNLGFYGHRCWWLSC